MRLLQRSLLCAFLLVFFLLPAAGSQTALADQSGGINCTMSSDYTDVTFSAPAENLDGDAFFTLYAGEDQVTFPASAVSYDSSWKANGTFPAEYYDSVLRVTLTVNGTETAERSLTVPALSVGSTPLPGLSLSLYGTDRLLSPQSAGSYDYFFLPSGTDLSALQIRYDTAVAMDVSWRFAAGGSTRHALASGDTADLSAPDGFTDCDALFITFDYTMGSTACSYTVGLMRSANLHSVFFDSNDPDAKGRAYIEGDPDHERKATGLFSLYDRNLTLTYSGSDTQIKGRGNTTWGAAKKPYQIKLNKKADLLDPESGIQKAKKWILLSNPFDLTQLHNAIAFDMAYALGMETAPQGFSVDFYYDGEYRGSYYLCEKNEIGEGRIDIHNLENDIEDANPDVDLDSLPSENGTNANGNEIRYVTGLNDPEDISGGYLLELDYVFGKYEKNYFATNVSFTVSKEPEYLSKNAAEYISTYMDEVITCIHSGGINKETGKTLFDYIDRDSLVRYFLAQEWPRNNDFFTSSTFFYKDRGEDLLFAGPIWDCDAAFGTRSGSDDIRGWNEAGLIRFLFKNGAFLEALAQEYNASMKDILFTQLFGETGGSELRPLSAYIAEIAPSVCMNDTVWGHSINDDVFFSQDVAWQEFSHLYDWTYARSLWLDEVCTTLPVITEQPVSVTANRGDAVRFTVSAQTSKPVVYQWQYQTEETGDWINVLNSEGKKASYSFKYTAKSGIRYRCSITNTAGTVYSETVTLTEPDQPSAPAGLPFLDVPDSASYYKALTWAFENGIVKGTDDSHFTPNGSCTRGEFCTMLWRLKGKPSIEGMSNPFADVTPGKGHGTAIVWCYNRKIITGMTDASGTRVFRSSGKISRTNMIVMLYKMAKADYGKEAVATAYEGSPYKDIKASNKNLPAYQWAYVNKISRPSNGRFAPSANCLRWQLVTFLYRYNNAYSIIP